MKYILGISAFYHDSAAALILDGQILCAFQEERFTRIKQDNSFPVNAINACLNFAKIDFSDISLVSYYENPKMKFQRICKTYLRNFPKGAFSFFRNLPRYLKKRNIKKIIQSELLKHYNCKDFKVFYSEHHLSHAASAFFTSPFQKAAVLCVDGVGEWATVSAWDGDGNKLKLLWQIDFPHSLGLLYSTFTYFCGFKVDSGEYKLMGLAPYGEPRFVEDILKHLINLQPDGEFTLNRRYFNYEVGHEMTSPEFNNLFGGDPREPEAEITQREMDLAASIQVVTEMVMMNLAKRLKTGTQLDNLCLAGGVALNCVANGKLLNSGLFKEIYIQPASGDAGAALGAALVSHYYNDMAIRTMSEYQDSMQGAYLGNSYTNCEIKLELERFGAAYTELDDHDLLSKTSQCLMDEKVVGWFQGRMEFGPRALGSRSILGNPMAINMQSIINLKIKQRESFRPFAPAVLREHVHEWFQLNIASPYMLLVARIHESKRIKNDINHHKKVGIDNLQTMRSIIQAVTHVDYSARIQTVDGQFNQMFHALLESFYQKSGCPMLINTSFNVRGEPIVESPLDAYRCFMKTDMDCLVIGNFVLFKGDQPPLNEFIDWSQQYVMD